MLEAVGLKKSFGDRLIFENASFTIESGSCVGFYGESGIGKSTLAKILCGVLRPDEGKVRFMDEPLIGPDVRYDRKLGLGIQMVYQQPYSSLDPRQRVGSGLRELVRYHELAPRGQEERRLIEEIVSDVGLEPGVLSHLPRQTLRLPEGLQPSSIKSLWCLRGLRYIYPIALGSAAFTGETMPVLQSFLPSQSTLPPTR